MVQRSHCKSEKVQWIVATITRPSKKVVEEINSRFGLVSSTQQCFDHCADRAPIALSNFANNLGSFREASSSCSSVKDKMSVRCSLIHWRTLAAEPPMPDAEFGGILRTPRTLKVQTCIIFYMLQSCLGQI